MYCLGSSPDRLELAEEDEHADSGQHSLDHRGRYRTEVLPELHQARAELNQAGEQHNNAEGGESLFLNKLKNDDAEAGGRSADLHGGAGKQADDDAADDGTVQAERRRGARSDRDAHGKRQGDEKDNDRRRKVMFGVEASGRRNFNQGG